MNVSCFNSSDQRALEATLLYDDNVSQGHLWSRGGQNNDPLLNCSNNSPPPDGCLVCLEQIVYAVCTNLMDGVKMVLEADGENIKISKSGCPKPTDLSDGVISGQLSAGVIAAIVIMSFVFIIIIAGVVGYKCWRHGANYGGARGD